jgi:hypothetical protein
MIAAAAIKLTDIVVVLVTRLASAPLDRRRTGTNPPDVNH